MCIRDRLTAARACKEILLKTKGVKEENLLALHASRNQLSNSIELDQNNAKASLDKNISQIETDIEEAQECLKDLAELEEFLIFF